MYVWVLSHDTILCGDEDTCKSISIALNKY